MLSQRTTLKEEIMEGITELFKAFVPSVKETVVSDGKAVIKQKFSGGALGACLLYFAIGAGIGALI